MKLGLVPKIIIGIILGTLIGQYMPTEVCRLVVTLSGIFSNFLKFVIPMMILAYVTMGIADLTQGAGKLLLITALLAYGSTLIGGTFSFFVADNLFPSFISSNVTEQLSKVAGVTLEPFFSISIPPILDTISAVVLAFILGLSLSALKGKTIGDTLYGTVKDFSGIIDAVLTHAIIPFLPLYVCGTFVDMTKSGKTFVILGVLWKVFLVVIAMHFILLFVQFMVAGTIGHKNPFMLMKNQVPGYTTALGTQSSAATIPVNKEACDNIGVPKDVSDLVLPMGCTMHMDGSAMSAIIKVAFLFGVFGLDFTTEKAILAIIVAVFSSVAMSGIPGGGGTGELVVCTIFFPDQLAVAYPIALAIGNLVDPPATMVNSAGDYVVSYIVSRFVEGKDWLQKQLNNA